MNSEDLYETLVDLSPEFWDEGYIRKAIQEGIDLNVPIEEEFSLIGLAAMENRLDVVKLFVDFGASVEPIIESGDSPIILAALQGFQDIFDFLAPLTSPEERRLATMALPNGIRKRAKTECWTNDFTKAGSINFLEFVCDFINNSGDVNIIGENGCTLIWTAAHNGYVDSINALIKSGADVNLQNENDNWSPLMIAALTHQAWSDGTIDHWGENMSRQIDVVEILISAGARVNDDLGNMIISVGGGKYCSDLLEVIAKIN